MILTIARTELKRMFYSPLAWSVLAVVQFLTCSLFVWRVEVFSQYQIQAAGLENSFGVTDIVVSWTFEAVAWFLLVIVPLMTMRTLSEEKSNKSLTLLTSSPLSVSELVFGKYLGLLGFLLIMLGMITLMPLSLASSTSLDWGKIAAGLLGLTLLVGSFGAAGMYLSSLTTQPIIAAVSSFGLLLFLVILYILGNSQATGSNLFIYLSHYEHLASFLRGVFDTSDLAYYLLFIAGFLILTIHRLDNERLQR